MPGPLRHGNPAMIALAVPPSAAAPGASAVLEPAGVHGLCPSRCAWQPDAGALQRPALVELLRFWQRLPRRQGVPLARGVDATLLGPLAEHALLLDLVDGGPDALVRHQGAAIARHYGADLTGRLVSTLDAPDNHVALAVHDAVIRQRRALLIVHETATPVLPRTFRLLLLPLAGARGRITTLLVGAVPDDAVGLVLDTVSDALLIADAGGLVQVVNAAAERMFASPCRSLARQPIDRLLLDPATPLLPPSGGGSTVREMIARRADGSTFPCEVSIGETAQAGRSLRVAVIRDITARKRGEAEMRRLAYHDALTGAANRTLFTERLLSAIARARRERQVLAVVLLDLDALKRVNDNFGHATGDALLRGFAERVGGIVRETDLLARLGGDEFAVLLTGLQGAAGATVFARRVLETLAPPLLVDGVPHPIRASLGIAVWPMAGLTPEALLRSADEALYRAKRAGGASFGLAGRAAAPRTAAG